MIIRRLLVTFAVLSTSLTMAPVAGAHRLDEYLQATRLAVDIERVDIELDLTPGVALAWKVLGWIDTNGDGEISATEGEAYAQQVLRSLALSVDGLPASIQLAGSTYPQPEDMRLGIGIIRLRATAKVAAVHAGRHRIAYLNLHHPESSVYLVNALVPANPGIRLGDQRRDRAQHGLKLDYAVVSDPVPAWPFALPAGLALGGRLLFLCRRKQAQLTPNESLSK